MYSVVVTDADADLVMTPASQEFKPKSDIADDREVKAASKVYKDEMAALSAQRKDIVRDVPPKLDAVQVMPGYSIHFM